MSGGTVEMFLSSGDFVVNMSNELGECFIGEL